MARQKKATDGKSATGVEALRGAGYDKGITQEIVERIENVQADIDAIMSKAQDECAPLREDIDAIKEEAHNKGLPRLELNAILSKRRALRRAEAIREKLNDEQKDNFDQLEFALDMRDEQPERRAPAQDPDEITTGPTIQ